MKLQDWYVGPLKVLKGVGPIAYKLYLSHGAALKTIHPILYIILPRNFEDNGLWWQPPPIEVNGLWDCKIEAIVGHQIYREQPQ